MLACIVEHTLGLCVSMHALDRHVNKLSVQTVWAQPVHSLLQTLQQKSALFPETSDVRCSIVQEGEVNSKGEKREGGKKSLLAFSRINTPLQRCTMSIAERMLCPHPQLDAFVYHLWTL